MRSAISKVEAQNIQKQIAERQPEIVSLIKALVETESPSGDASGNRQVVDLLVAAANGLRCVHSIERIPAPDMGEHLVIRAFQKPAEGGDVMLVGHTDTVHSRGSLNANPCR